MKKAAKKNSPDLTKRNNDARKKDVEVLRKRVMALEARQDLIDAYISDIYERLAAETKK